MFDHVTIRVSDRAASRGFYQLALGELGHEITHSGEDFDEWRDFSLVPRGERPECHLGYHGAYVLDPDGNNVEAVCHDR